MAQGPGQQYGTTGEQYGGQVGQQGTPQVGQQTGQYGQGAQQYGQGGGQQQGMAQQGRAMDIKLEEGLSDEMRVVLHDLVQSATACEWCAERCIDEGPEMAECLRLCRDVADLATLNVQLLARDSVFGPEAIEVFASAAEACAQECARHGHRHCQECAEELSRAVQSTRKMLASFSQMQGGQTGGAPMPGGQMQPQGGSFQGGSFGQPPSQPQAPGQQTQLPTEGGGVQGGQGQAFQQPEGGSFGQPQGQQTGQHYAEGQPQGQSGTQSPPPGQQF